MSPSSRASSSVGHPQQQATNGNNMSLKSVFKHVHTAVLLSSIWVTFGKLVEDPPTYLFNSFFVLAALQVAYATLCLDSTGSGSSKKKASSSAPGSTKIGGKKATSGESIGGTKILPAILALSLASTAGTVTLYAIMVLMGAPLTTHVQHTAFAAAHMSLLVAFPLVYSCGVDPSRWREIVALQMPLDEAYGGALGAMVGAWLGAVPIPLDWDRDWQKWPVTIIAGVYIGYAVGRLAGTAFQGRKLTFKM